MKTGPKGIDLVFTIKMVKCCIRIVGGDERMSYAVIRVKKFKASDVRGIQIHNQRESTDMRNMSFDRTRTWQNYDLRNPDPIKYNIKIKAILKEGYKIDKAIRKDAVVMIGTLVSSDIEFFSGLSLVDQRRYFEDAYFYLKERYGLTNIVAAVVHLDEITPPHMHVISVPLTEDGRLSGRDLFDRTKLRELQAQLPKFLQAKGFDVKRGEIGSFNKYVDRADYLKNKITAMENEILFIQKKIITLQTEIISIDNSLDAQA